MMISKRLYSVFCSVCCGFAVALTSCSSIDENERLIYVDPGVSVDTTSVAETDSLYDAPVAVVPRNVLIEDHTGQKCPNCPEASKLVHDFVQQYGNRVIPVAIHSEAQGIMEPEGLGTQLGNTYYNNWNIKFKPAGLISRVDGGDGVVLDKTVWIYALQYVLGEETPLDIRVKAVATETNTADVDVKVICAREGSSVNGKLQVWLTEDNIVAEQDSMGVHLADYIHNHVLRAAVNGTWGESVSLTGTEGSNIKEFHYAVPLSQAWKPENLTVVAFVYGNDDGVVAQAAKAKLKIKE